MGEIGRQIRELFDEVADPIDIREIVALPPRRGWRGWQITAASALAALVVVGVVAMFGSADLPPATSPFGDGPTDEVLPYLGLELEGWVVTLAGEAMGGCGAMETTGPFRQVSYEPVTPVASGPIHINVGVFSAAAACDQPLSPTDAADLGPPADPPFVNDHGFTDVMGHEARILDEQGTFEIRWLIGTIGAGHIHIFGNGLTKEDAIAIAGSVVEMEASDWESILARFPNGGTTTTIAPDVVVDGSTHLQEGPLSSALLGAVDQIPDLAALTVELASDHVSTGDEPGEWGGVTLIAADGSRVEIILQVVPEDFDPLFAIGPDTREIGPNGEDVLLRTREAVLQVVVIDRAGPMVNVIVDRFARSSPGTPGDLSHLSIDQVKDWALLLLDIITR